ncbi:MAG: winged helix-turn-helix domain-containing protein, partial [Rubrivivax sp.]|nr:winged helix-turn-helix domain-containing protein [Rubrivivax sp.]
MPQIRRFGRFELRIQERLLLDDGQPRPLGARALDVLIALVEGGGALVSKEQLLQRAWPGLVVEEANVHVQVSHLRKLLGPRAIATVAPLGYRFAMPGDFAPGQLTPNNLPAERTRFIGREAPLDDAAQRLGQARLLTLAGIGGSGKTRLALRLAAELQARFPDGVWFVDLAALEDGAQVALALARALGLAQAVDTRTLDLLAARVHGSTMLVVLDNCEHLLDAVAELVSTLLAAAAELRVLATSREALGLAGENVMPVRPLSLPPSGAAPCAVARAEAVRLFVERACEALPGFTADGESLATAAAICRRVDGIPLAIELAAAQLRVLGAAQILGLLEERFQLLVGSRRSLPRQQTLAAVVRWSWDRLEQFEQRLLCALAICSGGCDLAAAAALHGGAAAPVALVEGLGRLAALTLLQVERPKVADAGQDSTRYTMLETVRQFVLEQLHGSGQAAPLRDRHRDHFLALAEAEERHLMQTQDPGRVIEHLDAERDNLLQALAWCRQVGDSRSELRLIVALRHYWGARGLLPLGHELSLAALARAPGSPPSLEHCGALAAAVQLAQWMGRHEESQGLVEQQLAQARALGDDEWLGAGLHLQGELQCARGELEAATSSLRDACDASRRCGDLRRLG